MLRVVILGVLYLFLLLVIVAAWRELRPAAVERRHQAALEIVDPARAQFTPGDQLGLISGVTVGREAGNGLRIEDESVSSRHALFRHERGRWWLEDLGSTNGTFINQNRIAGREALRNGDVIQLGRVVTRFIA